MYQQNITLLLLNCRTFQIFYNFIITTTMLKNFFHHDFILGKFLAAFRLILYFARHFNTVLVISHIQLLSAHPAISPQFYYFHKVYKTKQMYLNEISGCPKNVDNCKTPLCRYEAKFRSTLKGELFYHFTTSYFVKHHVFDCFELTAITATTTRHNVNTEPYKKWYLIMFTIYETTGTIS